MRKVTDKGIERTCDFCPEMHGTLLTCWGCSKDLCMTHRVIRHYNPFTGADLRSDIIAMCYDCSTSASILSAETAQMIRDTNNKVKELEKEWRENAKNR